MLARRDLLKLAALAVRALRALPQPHRAFPTQIAHARRARLPHAGRSAQRLAGHPRRLVDSRSGHQPRGACALTKTAASSAQFDTETDRGSGITFDGSALWIASTYNRLLVRIDPQTGQDAQEVAQPRFGIGEVGSARGTSAAHRRARPRVAERRVVGGGAARGAHFRGQPRRRRERTLLPRPRRAAAWHRLGSGRRAVVRREHLPVVLQNGPGQRKNPDASDAAAGSAAGRWSRPGPHGMTIWNREFWFSVAETGEVYRVPLPG